MDYHEFSGLKQGKLIITLFCRTEVLQESHWAKPWSQHSCVHFWRLKRKACLLLIWVIGRIQFWIVFYWLQTEVTRFFAVVVGCEVETTLRIKSESSIFHWESAIGYWVLLVTLFYTMFYCQISLSDHTRNSLLLLRIYMFGPM